jgi:hypothetical protein
VRINTTDIMYEYQRCLQKWQAMLRYENQLSSDSIIIDRKEKKEVRNIKKRPNMDFFNGERSDIQIIL